ncbi:TonB-dependent receptor family protein [Sinomicrobium kalidii]|uniref:TonB-dependent receptor n=1 Tax=Sinomicrobium kalidii TaxID=2900738 RepID=UPI001E527BD5|nr:TonB-dependent receptor [Sinomicrobium kalidii]UGU15322.1 TonB-dependent receptor family protein [Sinomicrobium kalidii]
MIFLLLSIPAAWAQRTGTLEGSVLDSVNREPVPGATVIVNRLADDTRVGAVVTGMEGDFTVEGLPQRDTLLVDIRYLGYQPFRGLLYLTEAKFTMAPVKLWEGAIALEDVEVKGVQLPMIIRGDTLEYNVSAFTTRPYSEIKELFKKMPGMEVGPDGSLTHNGQRISRILVDGREYFGTDGRMALSILPVDVVEKIQLADTDETEDIRMGNTAQKTKTLNIQLKENLKDFGNLTAGGGTDHRYELMGKFNRFRGESRLTVLGMLNNINAVDYTEDEVITVLNAGNGITRTLRGGINYNDRWESGTELSAGYDYTHPGTFQESLKERIQFIVPDSSFTTTSNSTTSRGSDEHRLNISTSIPLDSTTTLQIRVPQLSLNTTNNSAVTHTTTDEAENPVNTQQTTNHTEGKNMSLPLHIEWQKLYSPKTHLNISFSGTISRDENEDLNTGETTFHKEEADSTTLFRQQIITDNYTNNYTLTINHGFPIAERLSGAWYNTASYARSSNERKTWLLDENYQRTGLDSLGSNAFRTETLNNTTNASLRYTLKKVEFSAGLTLNYNRLSPYNKTLQTGITRDFINIAPSFNINYRITDKQRLTFSYNAYTSPPSATQLQPVADNSNPLFIQEGNPDLAPTFYQLYSMHYNALNTKGNSFFANISYTPVKDQIISTTTYDDLGRQVSSYINADGVSRLYGYFGFSARKLLKTGIISVKLSGNTGYNRDRNFINEELVSSDRWTLAPNLQAGYVINKVLDIDISYSPQYNKVKYDKASGQNQDFTIHTLSGSLDLYPFKNLVWGNQIGFIRNNNIPDDFEKGSLLWNMDVSWLFLKDDRAELRFRVFDLLKQNRNISRTATQNYIEDVQSNNLQQYFMLSFGYHIR